jgi:hypothetical protein
MIFYVYNNRLKRNCNLQMMKLKFGNENFEQLFCTLQHSKLLLDFLHINGLCVMFSFNLHNRSLCNTYTGRS